MYILMQKKILDINASLFRIYKVIKHEFKFFFLLQYLQGLEDSLQEFNDQNKKLQEENELLKKKLQFLQDEVICCTFNMRSLV